MNHYSFFVWFCIILILDDRSSFLWTEAVKTSAGFLVNNPGCRIPDMNPFDPLIQNLILKLPPLDCANANQTNKYPPKQLVASNLTSLFVDTSTLADYNISDVTELECCYRPFWRVDGDPNDYGWFVDDQTEFAEYCTSFEFEANIVDEFVKVECQINDHEMYTDYYAFTPLRKYSEYKMHASTGKESKSSEQDKDSVSVVVIGIDGVSRLNFHRQMTRTLAFLKEMHAVELLGFNKVGDNTFPNLVPVLTGLSVDELRKSCWPTDKTSFDNCTFLWKNFSDAGYVTAFAEDSSNISTFTYGKSGFVFPPTDYYMRPYSLIYENEFGHSTTINSNACIRSRLFFEVLLEYASKFIETMSTKRSFGFFWQTSLTHDDVNYPQLGDDLLESWLRQMLTNSTALNSTVLVLMSDHGIRWGPIRRTYQGRLEESLPFVYFVFPSWFSDKYSDAVNNLHRNTRRLTTPFDLYLTLADLIDLSVITNSSIKKRTKTLKSLSSFPRGSSLFLPVRRKRTCSDAGIAPIWCSCKDTEALEPASKEVHLMAEFLVEHINQLLLPHPECAPLKLSTVLDARVLLPVVITSKQRGKEKAKDYLLTVQTKPGDAIFEATLYKKKYGNFKVSGTISRINKYGNQSACIEDYELKLYCYC